MSCKRFIKVNNKTSSNVMLIILVALIAGAVILGYPFVRGELVKNKIKKGKPVHVSEYQLAKQKFPILLNKTEAKLAKQGKQYPVIEWEHTMQEQKSEQEKKKDPRPPGHKGSYYDVEPIVGK